MKYFPTKNGQKKKRYFEGQIKKKKSKLKEVRSAHRIMPLWKNINKFSTHDKIDSSGEFI